MSHPQSAIIDFSAMEEAPFGIAVKKVVDALTLNAATFTALPVSAAAMQHNLDNYLAILVAAIYPTRTVDLAAARKVVLGDVNDNGVYVNSVAKHDLVILGQSGYPISKAQAPVGPLAQTQIAATSINGGFEVNITPAVQVDEQKVVANAHGYLVLYADISPGAPAPSDDYHTWPWAYLPKHTGTITGLKRGNPYRLVSAALGTDPTLVYSYPIDRVTQ